MRKPIARKLTYSCRPSINISVWSCSGIGKSTKHNRILSNTWGICIKSTSYHVRMLKMFTLHTSSYLYFTSRLVISQSLPFFAKDQQPATASYYSTHFHSLPKASLCCRTKGSNMIIFCIWWGIRSSLKNETPSYFAVHANVDSHSSLKLIILSERRRQRITQNLPHKQNHKCNRYYANVKNPRAIGCSRN